MKEDILPNSDFIETFVADVETRSATTLKVIADLASIEHPIETIITPELFITEILHEGYPAYWSSPEHEKKTSWNNGPRPKFAFKEWIEDFNEGFPTRLQESMTEVHEYSDGTRCYLCPRKYTRMGSKFLVGWTKDFLSFDHFNDRQVACVALGQIYAVLDWLYRFAPDHSAAIDLFKVNIYHKTVVLDELMVDP